MSTSTRIYLTSFVTVLVVLLPFSNDFSQDTAPDIYETDDVFPSSHANVSWPLVLVVLRNAHPFYDRMETLATKKHLFLPVLQEAGMEQT